MLQRLDRRLVMNTRVHNLECAGDLSGNRSHPNPKAYARSRLTNGKDLLANIDGRSLIARRYRDICTRSLPTKAALISCLKHGSNSFDDMPLAASSPKRLKASSCGATKSISLCTCSSPRRWCESLYGSASIASHAISLRHLLPTSFVRHSQ
jgi:hypothetical protein